MNSYLKSYFVLFVLFIFYVSGNAQVNSKDIFNNPEKKINRYTFIGRLVEEPPESPKCGCLAVATTYKFKIKSTNYPGYNNKFVLIIQACPEFYGSGFFKKKKKYRIITTVEDSNTKQYTVLNIYGKSAPCFWSYLIEKIE